MNDFRKSGDSQIEVQREMTRDEAIAEMRAMRTPLPEDYKFDREEANSPLGTAGSDIHFWYCRSMKGLTMHVSKWGNSLAIRLPAALVQEMRLRAGDEVSIRPSGESQFVVQRDMTREEAIEKLRTYGTPLPADYKFDREEANAR